jgi:hypothetical protein
MPVLRVLIHANLSRDKTIAVIAFQHAAEAVQAAPEGGSRALTEVFARLDPTSPKVAAYETEAAVAVSATVLGELRRHR